MSRLTSPVVLETDYGYMYNAYICILNIASKRGDKINILVSHHLNTQLEQNFMCDTFFITLFVSIEKKCSWEEDLRFLSVRGKSPYIIHNASPTF